MLNLKVTEQKEVVEVVTAEDLFKLDLFYLNVDLNSLKEGDEFNSINGKEICKKHVLESPNKRSSEVRRVKRDWFKRKVNELIDNKQFRKHVDTLQLGKHIEKIDMFTPVSITYKLHGTSGISSYVLANKDSFLANIYFKLFKKNIREYKKIHSSRNVIRLKLRKNPFEGIRDLFKEFKIEYLKRPSSVFNLLKYSVTPFSFIRKLFMIMQMNYYRLFY